MAYRNVKARIGEGTNNLEQQGEYPLTRISNNYMLLLALYRGHWIARKVIDVMAEDMLKELPRITGQTDPKAIDAFEKCLRKTATQEKILATLKWGRLFGGAVAVICIEGAKDLEEPLDPNEIQPGKYKGLIPLDRWSGVYPDAELIEDIGNPAEFGLPKYYRCDMGSNGHSVKIHHSRLLRFIGRDLPNWEKQVQLYWGMSELELVYDELRKRDYVSWSVASLVSRANIWAMKEPELAQILSGANITAKALEKYVSRMQAISDSMSNQGLLVLGKDGELQNIAAAFGGLAELLNTNMLDVAGACEIPVSRLYGRTITGLGQSGEGDLQIYYDTVEQKRNREVLPQIAKLYPVIAASVWGEIPDDMDYEFPPLRTISEKERSELAKSNVDSIVATYNAGIVGRKTSLMELRQQADVTGLYSNITDEMIEDADDEVGPDELSPLMPGEPKGAASDAWQESKHPREKGGSEAGQFTSGSGGGSSATLAPAPANRSEWPEHIQKLKLPPAWTDVRVNPDPDADLLAVGKDAKGRPQYVYSKRFQNTQSEAKFARIKELDAKFDKIRRQNEDNLKSDDPVLRENAECARLVMSTGIRPGSDSDTKAKVKAFGATTLEGQHVVNEGGRVRLRFVGKKGVAIDLPVEDSQIASALLDRSKKAGSSGRLFPKTSGASLLDYTHTLDGGGFKTKDFRTLLATRSAMNEIKKAEPPKNERDYKKRVMEIAKAVSSRLGNTPTVALQSYINPIVFAPWRFSLVTA